MKREQHNAFIMEMSAEEYIEYMTHGRHLLRREYDHKRYMRLKNVRKKKLECDLCKEDLEDF